MEDFSDLSTRASVYPFWDCAVHKSGIGKPCSIGQLGRRRIQVMEPRESIGRLAG